MSALYIDSPRRTARVRQEIAVRNSLAAAVRAIHRYERRVLAKPPVARLTCPRDPFGVERDRVVA